jgi:hypothetical protein
LVEKQCDSITFEEAVCQYGANRYFIRSQLIELKKQQMHDDELQVIIEEPVPVEPGVG